MPCGTKGPERCRNTERILRVSLDEQVREPSKALGRELSCGWAQKAMQMGVVLAIEGILKTGLR